MKRFRVIRRDIKSFLFELILPIVIIILALFLMRISFITDLPEKKFDISLWKNDSQPVLFGIAASDATLLNNMEAKLTGKYDNSTILLKKDTASLTDITFDANYLKN